MRGYRALWPWMMLPFFVGGCKAYDASLLSAQWSTTGQTAHDCAVRAGDRLVEACNGEDDDCDGVLDEDAVDCDRPNRSGRCVLGRCIDDGCDDGFADCNKLPSDGCERALGECTSCD